MQAEVVGTPAADETSDAVLLLRTREGSSEAYGALYLRHVAATRVLARQLARDPSEADELVAEAFTRVLGVLQRGAGPEAAFRPYLLSTLRRLHIDRRVSERRTQPSDDLSPHDPGEPFVDLPADELERSIVSSAFTSLPERWRLVLWHTEVEGLSPAQVAPLLGISANATAALAVRARAGLRDAYLSAHVTESTEPGCREIGPSLGGYVRGTLSRRERTAVDQHLQSCARCSAAVLELSDTASTMRAVIGPLVLGTAVLAYREGLISLGPHAIPTFAYLHSGGAALLHGAGAGAGAGAGGGGAGGAGGSSAASAAGNVANAGRVTWQVISAASLAGAVAVGAVVSIVLALGSNGTPTAARPSPGASSATPSSAATSATTPSPTSTPATTTVTTAPSPGSSSTSSSTPSSSSSAASAPSATSPSTSPSPTSTTPPVEVAAPSVDGGVSAVGDLVVGRPGYVTVRTTNPGHTTVVQRLDLDLPAGVTFDPSGQVGPAAFRGAGARSAALVTGALAATAGPCAATVSGVSCTLGALGPGQSTDAVVPVSVDASATGGAWSGTLVASSGGVERSTPVTGTLAVSNRGGVNAVFVAHGPYETTAAGNSLMSCQDPAARPDARCASVELTRSGGPLANGDWLMYPRNDAGGAWHSSASAQLSLPSGSTVVRAWLSWSATGVDGTQPQGAAVQAPGGKPVTVNAGQVSPVTVSGRSGYVALADVTDQVRAGGSGVWTVGDVALAAKPANQLYGGWALTVVTSSATAPQRDVTVLSGPALLTRASPWSGSALGLRGDPAQLTLVAWEGDADNLGESLSVYGQALAPADGRSTSADPLASYAEGALTGKGSPRELTFGVDVRSFDASAGPTGPGEIALKTTSDNFLLGMLAVSTGPDAAL